jgi:hypothetical protein
MANSKALPPLERIDELFCYDPITGLLTRKVPIRKHRAGAVVGCLMANGYLVVRVDGVLLLVHRICYAMHYRNDPVGHQVDHIDNSRTNNRAPNLRLASARQNRSNQMLTPASSSGYKGVSRRGSRWIAQITVNYKNNYLGCFDTPEQAHAAYCAAAIELHGDFANFG